MDFSSAPAAEVRGGMFQKMSGFLQRQPVILQLLRFAAIGVINTALDFLILNFVSKALGVTVGLKLGQVNIIGFTAAVIQSYFWNKYWAFGLEQQLSLLKNFFRLVLVGSLGVLAMLLVLLGAKISAPVVFYGIVLVVFLLLELVLWQAFGFFQVHPVGRKNEFWTFIVISVVGLIINSVLLAVIATAFPLSANPDLNKNLAKIAATGVSLVWNFIGYKIIVFKK